jgi:hypothetical protein
MHLFFPMKKYSNYKLIKKIYENPGFDDAVKDYLIKGVVTGVVFSKSKSANNRLKKGFGSLEKRLSK